MGVAMFNEEMYNWTSCGFAWMVRVVSGSLGEGALVEWMGLMMPRGMWL